MSSLPDQFAGFIDNISLRERQVERIQSATTALGAYLREAFDLNASAVFLQGSYANGTAIKPSEGGEYDVDVVVVSAAEENSATSALRALEDTLASHGRYKDRIEARTPCVRLKYADDAIGGFHVDVVPVRPHADDGAPFEVPRRGEGWHGTAPQEFTRWCAAQGDAFARTVKTLKHWRSRQQDRAAIKSILLQVLVSRHMPVGVSDDAERLALTLKGLAQALSGLDEVPVVTNPVLAGENLARRWTKKEMANFISHLDDASAAARKALDADDDAESTELWQALLGDDVFPLPHATALGVRLGDRSHAKRPEDRGWFEAYHPAYAITRTATYQRGRDCQRRRYRDNDRLLFPEHKLRFLAEVTGPTGGEIWWRVINTGGHARHEGGLRGDFFKAKQLGGAPSRDERENWEAVSYTGSHVIEAFLVVGTAVVAKSEQMRINIYSPKWRHWLP
ncbi:SMODS domain-containing nucleotidyltransferase [Geodermatophilus sp. SYSU D01105]